MSMGLIHQAMTVWQDLSVRLVLLAVPQTGLYVAASVCLAVVLGVLWRVGALRQRWARLGCAVVVGGLVAGIVGHAVWAQARANALLRGANARIAAIRKAPAQIQVVDAKGNPIAGASVRVAQRRHAFLFGCNAFGFYFHSEQPHQLYAERFSALFNYATLPFYWGMHEPQKGDTSINDQKHRGLADWLKTNHIAAKGHPLVWHEVYPAWAPADPEATQEALHRRIATIIPQFKTEIRRWDVVNEATVSRSFNNGLGRWVARDGSAAVVATALRWAHEADPEAELVYNDFNIGPQHRRLIEQLCQANAPFQIIGIQAHMHNREWPLQEAWDICEDYSRFGKVLHISELTVLSGKHGWALPAPWPTTPQGEQQQVEYVEQLYTLLFSHPAVQAITWWDLQDGEWMGAPGGLLHADLTPKPAYNRLLKLIHETWWTRESLSSNPNGRCAFVGFLGDYEITVQHAGRSKTVQQVLVKGANEWTITLD
jgi:endo-1,4-beta-xylanase